jgi:hypothetical protein
MIGPIPTVDCPAVNHSRTETKNPIPEAKNHQDRDGILGSCNNRHRKRAEAKPVTQSWTIKSI